MKYFKSTQMDVCNFKKKMKWKKHLRNLKKPSKNPLWIGFELNLFSVDFKLKTTVCRGGGGKLSETIRRHLTELLKKKREFLDLKKMILKQSYH